VSMPQTVSTSVFGSVVCAHLRAFISQAIALSAQRSNRKVSTRWRTCSVATIHGRAHCNESCHKLLCKGKKEARADASHCFTVLQHVTDETPNYTYEQNLLVAKLQKLQASGDMEQMAGMESEMQTLAQRHADTGTSSQPATLVCSSLDLSLAGGYLGGPRTFREGTWVFGGMSCVCCDLA